MKQNTYSIFLFVILILAGCTSISEAGNEIISIRTAPAFTSLRLESNVTTLNVGEIAELTVMATYSDGSTSELDANVEYIITPSASAEMNGTVLTAKKDCNMTVQAKVNGVLSNTLNLTIAWVVNGHVLPPEPDPTLNNATLAGVDSNDNGVRDDVERKIYVTYTVKLQRAIVMDRAIVFQEAMIRPVNEARETTKIGRKASNCRLYLRRKDSKIKSDEFRPTRFLENNTVNTKERIQKYLDYNIALSGGSYGSSPRDWNIEACSSEVIEALEEMGL